MAHLRRSGEGEGEEQWAGGLRTGSGDGVMGEAWRFVSVLFNLKGSYRMNTGAVFMSTVHTLLLTFPTASRGSKETIFLSLTMRRRDQRGGMIFLISHSPGGRH